MISGRLISILSLGAALALTACMPEPAPSMSEGWRISTTPPTAEPEYSTPPSAHEIHPSPLQRMEPIPARIPTVKVALLLPLSGDQQPLGKAMLDAATLALYDRYFTLESSQIAAKVVLLPKDTGPSPSTTAALTQQAISEGARLIIGPVFTPFVMAASPVARKAHVPMITLSNNRELAGDGVYVFGFLPEEQVARVAEYASLRKLASFGALVPSDAYGKTVSGALVSTLGARGIRVSPVERYAQTSENLEAAVGRLQQGYGRTPFTALFIGEGGKQLPLLLSLLQSHGLGSDAVRYLGTGLWDDEQTLKLPQLQGAWFASAPPDYQQSFERRFLAAYGYRPPRLASLAYDAVHLAAELAAKGRGPNFGPEALLNAQGFLGPANGFFRFHADGTVSRGLAVMQITPNGLTVLQPANAP